MAAVGWVPELRWALVGCWRLAKGDRGGLACFDRSLDGFWRSFRAAFLSYPLYLVLLMMRVSPGQWQAAGGGRIVAIETIGYVIAWVAFPLVVLSVAGWIGRERRFFDFMVPYNWCQLPQSLLFVLVGVASESGVLGGAGVHAINAAALVAVLVYEWYIARVALETNGGNATLIVLVDVTLGFLVSLAADSLY
jgi:hypothetical protein